MRTLLRKETAMRVVQYIMIKVAVLTATAYLVNYLFNRKQAQQ